MVAGESRFTSFVENPLQNEIGQIIRFHAFAVSAVRLYCVRKSVLPFAGGSGINDFPIVGGNEISQWNPTLFVPVARYVAGANTMLYFPDNSAIAGANFSVYRVFQ